MTDIESPGRSLVDLGRLRNRGVVPGIQLFACLDTVAPKGGGTVVVAGSHRVLLNTAPNTSRAPRLMVTERFMREDIMKESLAAEERA